MLYRWFRFCEPSTGTREARTPRSTSASLQSPALHSTSPSGKLEVTPIGSVFLFRAQSRNMTPAKAGASLMCSDHVWCVWGFFFFLPRYQVWQPAWCSSQPWSPSLASPHPYSPSTCQLCCATGPRVWPTPARSLWPFVLVCEGACRQRTGGGRGTGDGRDTWFVSPCRPPLRL